MKNKIELLRQNFDLKNALKLLDEIINLGDENFLNEFLYEFSDLLMKGDAIYLINSHVSYYLNKEDFQTALKVLNDYQNGPFINLTTEEFMEDLHQEILKLMSPKKNKYFSQTMPAPLPDVAGQPGLYASHSAWQPLEIYSGFLPHP